MITFVYAIIDPSQNHWKIGIAAHPNSRLRELQTARPGIEIRYKMECISRKVALAIERDLHKKFEKHNIAGEWFHESDGMIAYFEKHFSKVTDGKREMKKRIRVKPISSKPNPAPKPKPRIGYGHPDRPVRTTWWGELIPY